MQLTNWATVLANRHRYAHALNANPRARSYIERALGPAHLMTAMIQSHVAEAYQQAGRLREARTLIDSALNVLLPLKSQNIFEQCLALRVRAKIEIDEHQFADARRTLDSARAIGVTLDATRPDLLIALRAMEATAMAAERDSAGARRQLRQILTDYGQRREANPPAVLQRLRVRLDSLGT